MGIAEKLQGLMDSYGVSTYKLAKETGVSYTGLTKILSGQTQNPQIDSLKMIADFFGKKIDYFTSEENEDTHNPSKVFDFDMTTVEMVQIPIYGEVKAGYNSLAQEDIVGYEVVAKNSVSDGEYFFLIVKGDSMIEEGIGEGMRVLVKKQRHCQHGKIGVVIVNDDEGTLKRVFYEGDNIILQAANKNIPPRVFPIDEVMIQGQVTKVEFDV
ncbi:helix-turn-helix domain-containing protein [Paenibacillus monticola]|uniref:Helix-turn-helix domain-containing protein n=1 Tax=Paenibacillus monticola TaxID=2666075 RepID=A0A7X2L0D0_9BACL|nr:S24 family peptidase [Paenibacillus monticola]MRN51955.1 helix-turn-helix domain-containing protein [Paenibacillus monticola]